MKTAAPSRGRRIPALPTLGPRMLLPERARSGLPAPAFPLDRLLAPVSDGRAALYYLARNGVFHGLRALGVRAGDVALMPAYHHGVEVEAVRQAGARVVFYRVDGRFGADLDDVRAKARGARVLYLTYIAGWPQPIDEARAIAREHGLLLVEDVALSLFSRDAGGRPFGASADLAVFCLYKTLPVPHGGVALAAAPLPPGRPPPLLSTLHHLAGSLRAHAHLRRGRSPALEAIRALAHRTVDRVARHERTGTMHLDPAQLDLGASALARRLLPRFDAAAIVARRRENYRALAAALGDEEGLVPAPLPPGACPLFFPLLVGDKARALAEAEAMGVEAIDFWGTGDPTCDAAAFPAVARLRRHLLELPIHQDLDEDDVARVAACAKRILVCAGRAG